MSAPAFESRRRRLARRLIAGGVAAWSSVAIAQAPPAAPDPSAPGAPAAPAAPAPSPAQPAPAAAKPAEPRAIELSADGRYGIQVYAETLPVRAEPSTRSPVIAELQQGTRVEADGRQGTWFRVPLSDGRTGWIGYVAGRVTPKFTVDARPCVA